MPETEENKEMPKWGTINLLKWKLVPSRFGGGRPYIQRYKDAWVAHNRNTITREANCLNFPPELLAGVCWIEVGGDPHFIDSVALAVRSYDWSGPNWVDKHLTITKHPSKTSFGAVSIQLRTAASTLGLDLNKLADSDYNELASALSKDFFNIKVVAKHLRDIIDLDKLQTCPPLLSREAIQVAGARYNRGTGLVLEKIKSNTSYGDFILKIYPRLTSLLSWGYP